MAEYPWFEANTMFDGADGSVPIVVAAGEVDIATSPALAETIRTAMASRPAQLVVDLGAVEFIDASGIDVLVAAVAAARAEGREVVVRRPSERVRRLLDILGLNGALPTEDGP